jgi:hypothetical protein
MSSAITMPISPTPYQNQIAGEGVRDELKRWVVLPFTGSFLAGFDGSKRFAFFSFSQSDAPRGRSFREPARSHRCDCAFFLLAVILCLLPPTPSSAQNDRCDPNKVVSAESCARCHVNETAAWKKTPHFRTFDELGRSPEAQQISQKLGIRSVKRSDLCINCHFTCQNDGEKVKPIAGISCESCHGAAADWINVHNQYLSSSGTKESQTEHQRMMRLVSSSEKGMYNTRNVYQIASNCLNCHTIPDENLVNVGGHKATSDDFEFVRWSQGSVRHNFLRTGGTANAVAPIDQLRVMYVVGLIADLEYSTRASAKATEKSTYGLAVANRAARVAVQLYKIQQDIGDPQLEAALNAFAKAELRLKNESQLETIANQIRAAGEAFAAQADGERLSVIDRYLPKLSEYK